MSIKCVRCHMHDVTIHGQMCNICKINVNFEKKPAEFALDEEKMEEYTTQRILAGCKECGNNNFGFEAGIKTEDKLKWYVMFIQCGECGNNYTDVLEVSVDDTSECEQ